MSRGSARFQSVIDMKPHSDTVAKFCARWESRIPDVAINRAVYSTFHELKRLVPPIDPFAIAASRGIQIIPIHMEYDGVLSLSEAGCYMIELNKSHPDTRKRFTVAHELGHTLFLDLEVHRRDSRLRLRETKLGLVGTDRAEERLCNIAAAEILMPGAQFSAHLQSPVSAELIPRLSRQFITSLHSTALRVVALSSQNIAIYLWRYSGSSGVFETVWCAHPRGLSASLHIGPEQPIFQALRTGERFKGRRWLSLGGPLQDYFVEGFPLGKDRVLTVITFGGVNKI
jgi:Zn-dependent peptidase ImmA (M78 family)